MRHRNVYSLALSLCLVLGWQAAPAMGQFVSGSDETDGPLNVTANTVINLALADTGPWNGNDPLLHTAGVGVYDSAQWAVVFHYTTINIPAGVTVTFKNHPKGAPVIWLATGDVTIAGSVVLNGADGSADASSSYAIPGPGGFSGGISRLGGSAGFGPGGGFLDPNGNGGGGGYGTPGEAQVTGGGLIYGTASLVPLIGGSGGSFSDFDVTSGGAGGGAILIASSGDISLDSTGGVFATGGNAFIGNHSGSGSGGGIRLVANKISGLGLLRALGGTPLNFLLFAGGDGRIRVEATSDTLVDRGLPTATVGLPPLSVLPVAAPSLRVTSITVAPGIEKTVPADPLATVMSPDVCFTSLPPPQDMVTLNIVAQNVPLGQTVTVRIVDALGGGSQSFTSTALVDAGMGSSTATADVTFITGTSEVQLSVQLP